MFDGMMAGSDLPVVFEPIFKERIWGGRNLAASVGKNLPAYKRIGES
jgi:mannose-6-phosphate isomerase class I